MTKCKKTTTGKHIWKDYYLDDLPEKEETKLNTNQILITEIYRIVPKCEACGVMDEKNIKKEIREEYKRWVGPITSTRDERSFFGKIFESSSEHINSETGEQIIDTPSEWG